MSVQSKTEFDIALENMDLSKALRALQFPDDAQSYSMAVVALAVIVLTPVLYNWLSGPASVKVPIPLASQEPSKSKRQEQYLHNSRAVLAQGYAQFKDKPFGVNAMDGVKLILPTSFLDKLKSHPALSFEHSISHDLLKPYTGMGGVTPAGVSIITSKFNPTLTAFTPRLHEIIREYLVKAIGQHKTWKSVKVHNPILGTVTRASAYVMHSEEASNNQKWLDLTSDYVLEVSSYATALKEWHPLLRPFVSWTLPQRSKTAQQWNEAREIIRDTLKKRTEPSNPPTILDHLRSGKQEALRDNLEYQVEQQLLLAIASVHTTASSTIHCLYDLAARPEYIQELREEAVEVLKECGGTYTKEGVGKLQKLDSFMRESQRLNSPDLTTFQRIATEPLTLPDGTYVPAGTKMELPTSAVNADDSIFENSNDFDGLRFYKQRQAGGTGALYTSVGRTALGFGVGRHACPGRFLAEIEVKLFLAELLINYDFKNPDGVPRYKNVEFEIIVFADPEGEVMFKSRKSEV